MRRIFILLAAILLIASPAMAQKNKTQSILTITEVATDAPVTVTVSNPYFNTGYLSVKTENETATASLVVTIYNVTPLEDILVCTMNAITTDTVTNVLLGYYQPAAAGVDQVCSWPLTRTVKFVFTTTGVGADFDVTADMEWVAPGT